MLTLFSPHPMTAIVSLYDWLLFRPFSSPLLSATDKVLLIKLRVQNGLNWDFCDISDSDLNSALTHICLWPGASEPLGPSEVGGPRDQGLEWELETLRGPALGSWKYGLLKKRVSMKAYWSSCPLKTLFGVNPGLRLNEELIILEAGSSATMRGLGREGKKSHDLSYTKLLYPHPSICFNLIYVGVAYFKFA